jgi:hypothetical protein
MPSSQKNVKIPDAEAIEDDERQYGHGPLTKEELDQKCVSSHVRKLSVLSIPDTQIGLIITQGLYHFTIFSLHYLILSMITRRNLQALRLLVQSRVLMVPPTCPPMRSDAISLKDSFQGGATKSEMIFTQLYVSSFLRKIETEQCMVSKRRPLESY